MQQSTCRRASCAVVVLRAAAGSSGSALVLRYEENNKIGEIDLKLF